MKKNNTPTEGGRRAPNLAELLSAVLRHPDLPVEIHTDIGDWINSYGCPQIEEPERIRRALADYGKGARGGSAAETKPVTSRPTGEAADGALSGIDAPRGLVEELTERAVNNDVDALVQIMILIGQANHDGDTLKVSNIAFGVERAAHELRYRVGDFMRYRDVMGHVLMRQIEDRSE
jgi:hypothetical protein